MKLTKAEKILIEKLMERYKGDWGKTFKVFFKKNGLDIIECCEMYKITEV